MLDREAAEDRRLLRQIADALARAHVHRIVGDILIVEQHAAGIGRRQSHDHTERRRLAGAVRAEQADDFAGRDVEVDASHDRPAAVGLGEPFGAQRRHYLAAGAADVWMNVFSGLSHGIFTDVRSALGALPGSSIVWPLPS